LCSGFCGSGIRVWGFEFGVSRFGVSSSGLGVSGFLVRGFDSGFRVVEVRVRGFWFSR
jgi:hypothetical protein